MSTRLVLHPHHFLAIFTHPLESWFIGSFWLSISVIIGGIQLYGITYGPAYSWLIDAVYVLYWLYASFSFSSCIFQYYILIAQSKLRPVPFSPSMFLAGYSAMLTGTIASIIAGQQTPSRAVLVILSGLAFQGFGWLISSICLVYFVRLLLDKGLPPPQLRPALFIPVGSVAYTIVALIGQANVIPDYGYFAKHPTAREILQIMALFVGVFMWLFALFIFAIAVLANVGVVGKMPFSLTWWAFIFPNVGFMLSTRILGQQLDSPPILWIASVMTVLLVGIWIVSAAGCLRAVWTCRIAWPGKDEDKDL
jgi:tellurite resistance protein TehA-like permease